MKKEREKKGPILPIWEVKTQMVLNPKPSTHNSRTGFKSIRANTTSVKMFLKATPSAVASGPGFQDKGQPVQTPPSGNSFLAPLCAWLTVLEKYSVPSLRKQQTQLVDSDAEGSLFAKQHLWYL